MEGKNKNQNNGLGGKAWRLIFFSLSLLPLKLSPNPTTQ
jgi:hypothetical protein